jgi:hypothetical protein
LKSKALLGSKHGDDVSAGAADRSRSVECACSRPERALRRSAGHAHLLFDIRQSLAGRDEIRVESSPEPVARPAARRRIPGILSTAADRWHRFHRAVRGLRPVDYRWRGHLIDIGNPCVLPGEAVDASEGGLSRHALPIAGNPRDRRSPAVCRSTMAHASDRGLKRWRIPSTAGSTQATRRA